MMKNKFNPTREKYSNLEELRKKVINAHSEVLFTDFLSNLMVASIPWLGNALTKYRTKRSGYSGTYNMADEELPEKPLKNAIRLRNYGRLQRSGWRLFLLLQYRFY